MLQFLPDAIVAAVAIGAGLLLKYLLDSWANARVDAAVAEKDQRAAEHLATETIKAEETRREIEAASFDDAVDRL
ncbi:MAG TPA: hypothetical protein VIF61_00300 [Methylocystis sp.]|jgi:hypothetical protein